MVKENEIKEIVISHKEQILDSCNPESYQVFLFLREQLYQKDVSNNSLFSFVYKSFYKFENFSLTDEFEKKYFELLERQKVSKQRPDLIKLTNDLYQINNSNGNPTFQFPLVIAMLHHINPYFPTIDNNIATLYSFPTAYHLSTFHKKMKRSVDQYRNLYVSYQSLLQDDDIKQLLTKVEAVFSDEDYKKLPDMKKLDLLMNTTAKIHS